MSLSWIPGNYSGGVIADVQTSQPASAGAVGPVIVLDDVEGSTDAYTQKFTELFARQDV